MEEVKCPDLEANFDEVPELFNRMDNNRLHIGANSIYLLFHGLNFRFKVSNLDFLLLAAFLFQASLVYIVLLLAVFKFIHLGLHFVK